MTTKQSNHTIDICNISFTADSAGVGLLVALTDAIAGHDGSSDGAHPSKAARSWAEERARAAVVLRCGACMEPCMTGLEALEVARGGARGGKRDNQQAYEAMK